MARTVPFAAVSVFVALLFAVPNAEAALPPGSGVDGKCIKASFKGDASTYNPYLPGWRTGGGTLATGGPYNPNSYDAALQLGLAKQYRCGYGSRAICHAVVQAPNGRAMVVRINDNGPLVPGRVIDLNEKSMRYLSNNTLGNNKGVIKNVTVTLLCGIEGMALGPLEASDRLAWEKATFNAPHANVPQPSSPFAYASPFSNVASPVGQSFSPTNAALPPSLPPPVASPAAGPQQNMSQVLSPAYAGLPPSVAPAVTPVSSGVSDALLSGLSGSPYRLSSGVDVDKDVGRSSANSAASIIVQPRELSRGHQGVVSWTSVGMNTNEKCRVTVRSGDTETIVGEDNEGSRPVKIGTNSATGTFTFTLRCKSLAGERIEKIATLSVQ